MATNNNVHNNLTAISVGLFLRTAYDTYLLRVII